MYLVVTRSFPPELGGMQNLMWGLTNSISKYNLTKVFADYQENYKEVDDSVSFSIARFFVNSEFATIRSTLFNTSKTLLFDLLPLSWLISFE